MKRSGSLLTAAILTLTVMTLGVTTTRADDTPGTAVSGGREMVTGTVVSDEDNQLVITTQNGDRMTFRVEENAFTPIELVPGSGVEVTYMNSGGQYVTDRVLMAYPGGAVSLAALESERGRYTGPLYASNERGRTSTVSARRRTGRSSMSLASSQGRSRSAPPTEVAGGETGNGQKTDLAGGETGNGSQPDLAQNQETNDETSEGRLPGTAGPLPILAVAGLLSAAAGYGIRRKLRAR